MSRLAVIGAGGIGIEVALQALERGLTVEVFEKGPTCAGVIEDWHFVQLFSTWSLNATPLGLNVLSKAGFALPDESVYPTGREFIDTYLSPLAAEIEKHSNCRGFRYNTTVISVGRGALLKGESIGGGDLKMPHNKPLCAQKRQETPFRLLLQEGAEERFSEEFDIVVDCSGSYGQAVQANWCGLGGVPALGERALRQSGRMFTAIPDVLGASRSRFARRRTMIVGAGYSAVTSLKYLTDLAQAEPGTSVVWLTRSGSSTPFTVIEDDVLPARKQLCLFGNLVASQAVDNVTYLGGTAVSSVKEISGRLRVEVQSEGGSCIEEVDEMISCVGFHPDTSLYEELQVHQCYASNGPMKLAATLLGGSGDCLAQVSAGADALKSPEPNFFILGSKSYGRNSAFLLKIGYQQVQEVLGDVAPAGKL